MDIKKGIKVLYAVAIIVTIGGALGVRYIKNKTFKKKQLK